ncbi:PEP/pyruvate-binding domain-containing protein [Gracilinema caldarium]|uniref:Pyruvate phosphate dikinase PEP/pyruvate-binding protein n=1 Tax=Gracilinema caldarium (strain ATCC 51460 / DSM 7334 / H1) TaxID=744872 RepID=F8F2G8_GRAC1|nr:PEP/pyruvate-binding domain-containing protein [Gracilinema caldarium]AEJ19083.1 pyruvate phosphate dikinase PEP/pyruvate-binding protein [Gracilinema caldarium DSM 7334]
MQRLYSTGLLYLNSTLQGLLPGDNLVWEIDTDNHYNYFIQFFLKEAQNQKKTLIYFHFSGDEPLLTESVTRKVITLDPLRGFEHFVSDIVDIIEANGDKAWYVFDCLSPLAKVWYSDRMMANFFMVVCPLVLRLQSLAYFAIYKHLHSNHATDTIYATAQIIIEVWNHQGDYYLQPHRVEHRFSPTLFMLHILKPDGQLVPITNSAQTADVVAQVKQPLLNFTIQRYGPWTASYREAETLIEELNRGISKETEAKALFERLLHMVITRQTSFLPLARKYFTLSFLTDVLKRLIGSGLIGGKARGILLAQLILKGSHPRWSTILESHDSFFIGSDVFYTFVIQNDCWWLRRKRGSMEEILANARIARERILKGTFLDYIVLQFREMLEYFGQAPIIVRSSSIQEDSYGNAFSGKYESVFCANQGNLDERLAAFLDAVRQVYASSLNEDALMYRLHHGLLHEDEQMALLVQRVSGDVWGAYFFPPAAGVGFSYNPFVWNPTIDPHAGVLRLAFGLGTRAVDRLDDDYIRIVALNAPLSRPEKDREETKKHTQRKVDLINLKDNCFETIPVRDALSLLPESLRPYFCQIDQEAASRARELGLPEKSACQVDFSELFQKTDFCERMRELLQVLEKAYEHPVDVEFTVNCILSDEGTLKDYRINLVQCRPFQVKLMGSGSLGILPSNISKEHLFLRSDGPIVGRSVAAPIARLVYVSSRAYTALSEQDKYALARLIGQVAHPRESQPYGSQAASVHPEGIVMLVGPGRWGTSTPSMGVPVTFNDIKEVKVLVELALMHEGLVPDVSLGTHFFNDLVEMDMLYFAVFPERKHCKFNEDFVQYAQKVLHLVPPENELWASVLTVLESTDHSELRLYADATDQKAICYLVTQSPGQALPQQP